MVVDGGAAWQRHGEGGGFNSGQLAAEDIRYGNNIENYLLPVGLIYIFLFHPGQLVDVIINPGILYLTEMNNFIDIQSDQRFLGSIRSAMWRALVGNWSILFKALASHEDLFVHSTCDVMRIYLFTAQVAEATRQFARHTYVNSLQSRLCLP